MQLRDYWDVLRKQWLVILVIGFIGAAAAYGYSKWETTVFRSSAKLYVMPVKPDYGNSMFIQSVVRQYSGIMIADRFLQSVSEELRLDLQPEVLRKMVTATGVSDNSTILVDVDDTDAGRAVAIARQLARDFMQDQETRMKDVTKDNRIEVRVYDEPTPPVRQRPKTPINVAVGGLLGLLIGTLVAFSLEFLDDTVKSPEDVERYIALPVMGAIPTIPG
jgi:capsular polysaccharide biosynthesis protein